MSKTYRLVEGGLQHSFQQSRAKIRIFGGGFGNGKTTSGVILALQIAKDYPGANILIARSTYPKLNDTVRKEFLAWCPAKWIERKALSVDNVVELKNGTIINFRYIAQQGKSTESSTSNLLSATYDFILVDQIEDPEITEKDFNDLLGRLRGSTPYKGNDPTMPRTGPRWFVVLCNPTRNWVYKKLVKPLHDYQRGIRNPDLLVDNEGKPLIELFEGSTYENKDNLPEDFIETLEAAYQGQMRSRYLMGEWGAYEGLVYPQYDSNIHMPTYDMMMGRLDNLLVSGYTPQWIESYDHGMASPACYSLAFVDHVGNVFDLVGFYEKEQTIEQLSRRIKDLRKPFQQFIDAQQFVEDILADPAVFRRGTGTAKKVGTTVANLFAEQNIRMRRANNAIEAGINKVQSYLNIDPKHINPFDGTLGSPRLFFCADQYWIDNEIVDYYWSKDTRGEYEDKPTDRNDHAMDRIKYMLTHRPRVASFKPIRPTLPPKFLRWREYEASTATADTRMRRHAA